MSKNNSGHLSYTISIDPNIFLVNWATLKIYLYSPVDYYMSLFSFRQDRPKVNGPKWSPGSSIICLAVLKIENGLSSLHVNYWHAMILLWITIIHVHFELATMKVLNEIFWNFSIKRYRLHLAQVWWRQIHTVSLNQDYNNLWIEYWRIIEITNHLLYENQAHRHSTVQGGKKNISTCMIWLKHIQGVKLFVNGSSVLLELKYQARTELWDC